MEQYYKLSGFEDIYLEDSWVFDVKTNEHFVEILIEAVLTEKHHLYQVPKPDEQYCYKNGRILFLHPTRVRWIKKIMKPNPPDKDGSIDYGQIDYFAYENNKYKLEGSWGELEIISQEPPKFEFV